MAIAMMIQGIMVGFLTAAPVGPIGLLCIHSTLLHGMIFGLVCGLGAATADMMYGILVAMGMTSLVSYLLPIRTLLAVCGSLFLIYLGLKKLWSKRVVKAASMKQRSLLGAFISTYFLTLINPATILDFMALFTSFRFDITGYYQGFIFVAGVFLGSAAWWCLLSLMVGLFRKRISDRMIMLINYGAGLLLCAFGLRQLLSVVISLM